MEKALRSKVLPKKFKLGYGQNGKCVVQCICKLKQGTRKEIEMTMTTRQIKKYFAEATTIEQVQNMWKQYAEAWWQMGSTLPRSPYDSICEARWDALYRLGYKFQKHEIIAIESHKKYVAPWNR